MSASNLPPAVPPWPPPPLEALQLGRDTRQEPGQPSPRVHVGRRGVSRIAAAFPGDPHRKLLVAIRGPKKALSSPQERQKSWWRRYSEAA